MRCRRCRGGRGICRLEIWEVRFEDVRLGWVVICTARSTASFVSSYSRPSRNLGSCASCSLPNAVFMNGGKSPPQPLKHEKRKKVRGRIIKPSSPPQKLKHPSAQQQEAQQPTR
jgi:hypothetical protein